MSVQSDQIREQQKNSWNKFSAGWKKWDAFNMAFLQPMGDEIIARLRLKETDHVLDVAAGTGEPGITIAKITTGGSVIATDLSEDMLAIAQENAQAQGVSNYRTRVADACGLPFTNETFDAVSCRMGFMFFPDMEVAAAEMYRVLRQGGKAATSVWAAAPMNNWVTTIMSVIHKYVVPAPPIAGAPGMFRCAEPGYMAALLTRAGFINIREQQVTGKVDYESFDQYWELMLDVGAPIVAALSNADDGTRQKIRSEVADLFASLNPDGRAKLDYAAIVISAEK